MNNAILVDGRWQGTHGIGRFTHEVISRLHNIDILSNGPKPLSIQNLFWLPSRLHSTKYSMFFNPGFNPIMYSSIPYVLTIHDLIHLDMPGKTSLVNTLYYELLIKYSAKKAYKILTVSNYSKNRIIEWTKIPEDKITVVGNGISTCFSQHGNKYQPGYPYLLHVGNTKPHKNINRLIDAFHSAAIDDSIKLILTGTQTPELASLIKQRKLTQRVIFSGTLTDEKLAEYYRGATAFILPSLIEGFGIPIIEAMACGTPTLVSNISSLPEVAGEASLLIDPYDINSISREIENITQNNTLRESLIEKGHIRSADFSWDKTANAIQKALE